MKKFLPLLLAICLLTACKYSPKEILYRENPEIIKIGVFEPTTGDHEYYGRAINQGIQLAHRQRQEVLGKKVQIVYYDTKSQAYEAANAVTYLTQRERVQALIGTYGSLASKHSLGVVEAAKIPAIASGTTLPEIKNSEWYNVLSIDLMEQAQAMATFSSSELKLKCIAVMTAQEDAYGQVLSDSFIENLPEDVETVSLYYHSGDRDFKPQIRQLRGKSLDGIYCPGDPRTASLLIAEIKKEFPNIQVLGADKWDNPEFYRLWPSAINHAYFTTYFSPDRLNTNVSSYFLQSFRQEYGATPSSFSALGYDTYMNLIHAFDQADSTDPDKVEEALQKIYRRPGATGYVTHGSDPEAKMVDIVQQRGPYTHWIREVEVSEKP